jgi:histidyl-tRNA synthetase
MDKIGLDGVKKEFLEDGYSAEAVEKYVGLFEGMNAKTSWSEKLDWLEQKLTEAGAVADDVIPNLRSTIETVIKVKQADFKMVFDPTIVRGMSYYTGTIFEIRMPELGISCGGGGRYDGMVGKFTGRDVPACGFSIGFERIILILMEQHFEIPGKREKVAFLLDKGLSEEQTAQALIKAGEERKAGKSVLVVRMNKNKKFQKQQLSDQGYTSFEEFYNN